MRSRAYARVAVNQIDVAALRQGREGIDVVVGVDVGKYRLLATSRWSDRRFDRPWCVANPGEIALFVARLQELGQGRTLIVALEPSGSYGDALRQALHDAGIVAHRVSPKAAHDYAEIFDGVPSQHDGKDAAVIAELAALGKSTPWSYQPAPDAEQEMAYCVDTMDCQQRLWSMRLGHIEALLARHWPEATRHLKVSSMTLLRALAEYGGPQPLAVDPEADGRLQRWGGTFLLPPTRAALLRSARETVGVRQGKWEQQLLREHAVAARLAHKGFARARRRLQAMTKGHEVLEALGKAVGPATACVLWVALGDPRNYSCGRAYRKAMGLNLTERSSGRHQGKLKISKRGQPRTRRWLYLASLRLIRQSGVSAWYHAHKARDGSGKRVLVALMRKLALALHRVATDKVPFEAKRLFHQALAAPKKRAATAAAGR